MGALDKYTWQQDKAGIQRNPAADDLRKDWLKMKILQIMPAPSNLFARYQDDAECPPEPVVALALVQYGEENDGRQAVRAMMLSDIGGTDELEFAEDDRRFLRLNFAGEKIQKELGYIE